MPFFYAVDINGNTYRVTEFPGTETAQVTIPGKGNIWAYRVYTSTYIATDGKVYSNMRDKIDKYNTDECREYAFRKLRQLGYMY